MRGLDPPSQLPVLGGEQPTRAQTTAAQAEGYRRISWLLLTGCKPEDLYGEVQFITQQMAERGA
jgi:hypothetical protein